MKRCLRRVTKRSKTKFEHSLSIPANIVRELDLSESTVELKIKDGFVVIKKLA